MSRSGPRALALALLLSACAPPPSTTSTPLPPTPTAEVSPTATPPPAASPGPTASDTPVTIPDGTPQLGGALRSLASSWRPTGETLVIQQPADQGGQILTAVPLDGSSPIPLVAIDELESTDWGLRPNGSLAISLPVPIDGQRSGRVAVWNSLTGTANWASPPEPGVLHVSPVWSADGAFIFYSALRPPDDLGLYRVAATGGRATRIRAPEANGGNLEGLTPDGSALVWSRIQAGGSADVFDFRTGRNVTFDPNAAASAVSWRDSQPRGLVVKGGCCVVPAGTLYVWNDREGTSRAIFGRELAPNDGVSAAVWDPDGDRIVAAVWDFALSREMSQSLVVMNAEGGERVVLPGTRDVVGLVWARAGILYLTPGGGRSGGHGIGTEIMLLDPAGGPPRPFFRGSYIVRWRLLST